MVTDFPFSVMVYGNVFGDRNGFSKVNHPDGRSPFVVDEEEGAADELVCPEEVGLDERGLDALETV